MDDRPTTLQFSGTVVKISRTHEESQLPGAERHSSDDGWVQVVLGSPDEARVIRVPFPEGVPDGVQLGQRVRLSFGGADPSIGHGNLMIERRDPNR